MWWRAARRYTAGERGLPTGVFLPQWLARERTITTQPPAATPALPRLALPAGAVHLWQLALPAPCARVRRATALLAPDERRRALTFHFARDRLRFIAVRATLRLLLARHLALPPRQITLSAGAHGKPAIAERGPEGTRLCFNVSHTDGLALFALAWERELGVDVERVRPMPALDQIAARFFAPAERAALAALPPDDQLAGFFACWTRKEAYLKAHGAGLSLALDRFTVSLAPHEPARLLTALDDPDAPARWRLAALALPVGYCGALVAAGHDWTLEPRGDAAFLLA